jgi:hypothetical protein
MVCWRSEGFCQAVGWHLVGRHIGDFEVAALDALSYPVVDDVDVFRARVVQRVTRGVRVRV